MDVAEFELERQKLAEMRRRNDLLAESNALMRETLDYQKKCVQDARETFNQLGSMISVDVQGGGKA